VEIVELPARSMDRANPWSNQRPGSIFGVDYVSDGRVDAIYGKGAAFADQVAQAGLVEAVNLDSLPSRRNRVNNGTPRPITVHERLLEERPDLVVSFLAASLRASEWAGEHPDEVREILQRESFAEAPGVLAAHGSNFHRSLHPSLSEERLELFAIQKQFLHAHGFLAHEFDLEDWVARGPLEEALSLVANAPALNA
jgi:ABC-type nitrate/sulfonate/bicarbonate transport system substrate-binding protein